MTVFVVHPVSDDLTAALAFGELCYVNRHYVHGDELVNDPSVPAQGGWVLPVEHETNMREAAWQWFEPDTDYLLIAGDHLQLLAVSAMLACRFQWFNVLRYDRKISGYIPVRLYSRLPPGATHANVATDIGEMNHEKRSQEADRLYRANEQILGGLEAPLSRRDPRKR